MINSIKKLSGQFLWGNTNKKNLKRESLSLREIEWTSTCSLQVELRIRTGEEEENGEPAQKDSRLRIEDSEEDKLPIVSRNDQSRNINY
ncbi:hypothetical protein KQX54_006506 [Cotesia glomerata]|uniref:Uncharacterized protein n=1 Tax=Cotesia glomerata TaxID=32391 RepID=A0AAV7IJF9_COTGL|nr:hypothetical protein KQX54_006506 [Cotesia glomerata]